MPIYEFQCEVGHITETIVLSKYLQDHILCPKIEKETKEGVAHCGLLAKRIWSVPANINIGKPTIVFRDPKTGRTELAASDYDTPPQGYVKELLSNPIERSKYEREEQKRVDLANEIITEKMKQDHSETRKNRHADIESRMNDFPNDGTREFLRKAMQRKSKRKFPEKKSQVKLTVNHTDSSNLIK